MSEHKKIAIEVSGVYKNFILPHQKVTSVKSIFTNPFQSRSSSNNEIQHAIEDVNFKVEEGEFFGIVGRNGSGKSTLLKIIAEIYRPTKGHVKINGRLVPFIELGVGFNPELSGRENVYLNGALMGFSDKEIDEMYEDIVAFAELEKFMDQKLKNYSSGMQVRLAFSVATRSEADILLIDEVLAVGDADFQRKCFAFFRNLKRAGKTIIFVSHDMDAIRRFCDRAVLIDNSKVVMIGGAEEVAQQYTKMFIDEAKTKKGKQDLNANRSGDGAAFYHEPRVEVTEDHVTISTKLEAREDIEGIMYGFYVKNTNGQILFGKNSRMYHKIGLRNLKKEEKEVVEWVLPNVFNEGEYYLAIGASYEDGEYADLWEEAAMFSITAEYSNPFLVNPQVRLEAHKV